MPTAGLAGVSTVQGSVRVRCQLEEEAVPQTTSIREAAGHRPPKPSGVRLPVSEIDPVCGFRSSKGVRRT